VYDEDRNLSCRGPHMAQEVFVVYLWIRIELVNSREVERGIL